MAVICLALPGPVFAADAAMSPDIARIQQRGTLIVAAYKTDMPPFFYVDEHGKLGGIDVDLATDIANRLGVKLDYARIADSFDDLPALVAQRKADVAISYLSRTLRRATVVRFTQPYVRLRQTIMVNRTKTAPLFRNGERIEALDDPSVRIGVEDGSSYVDYAIERFPKAQLQRYRSNEDAVEGLLTGQLHAVIVDEAFSSSLNRPVPGVPHYRVRDDWALYVKVIPLTGARDPIAMAVHRDDQTWLAWLDTYIADRQDDGFLDRLLDRHLGGPRK
jgi:ABC-type amino acid transport substrate-binding protein